MLDCADVNVCGFTWNLEGLVTNQNKTKNAYIGLAAHGLISMTAYRKQRTCFPKTSIHHRFLNPSFTKPSQKSWNQNLNPLREMKTITKKMMMVIQLSHKILMKKRNSNCSYNIGGKVLTILLIPYINVRLLAGWSWQWESWNRWCLRWSLLWRKFWEAVLFIKLNVHAVERAMLAQPVDIW